MDFLPECKDKGCKAGWFVLSVLLFIVTHAIGYGWYKIFKVAHEYWNKVAVRDVWPLWNIIWMCIAFLAAPSKPAPGCCAEEENWWDQAKNPKEKEGHSAVSRQTRCQSSKEAGLLGKGTSEAATRVGVTPARWRRLGSGIGIQRIMHCWNWRLGTRNQRAGGSCQNGALGGWKSVILKTSFFYTTRSIISFLLCTVCKNKNASVKNSVILP